MKRSEMIKEISFQIAKQAIHSGNHEIDLTWLDCDKVLFFIEQAGMLPPLNENWMSLDECKEFYGPSWENDVSTYPRKNIHRWESEDDSSN